MPVVTRARARDYVNWNKVAHDAGEILSATRQCNPPLNAKPSGYSGSTHQENRKARNKGRKVTVAVPVPVKDIAFCSENNSNEKPEILVTPWDAEGD